jgi:hypothetical protein
MPGLTPDENVVSVQMNHAQVMALSQNFAMDMTFVNGCKICI